MMDEGRVRYKVRRDFPPGPARVNFPRRGSAPGHSLHPSMTPGTHADDPPIPPPLLATVAAAAALPPPAGADAWTDRLRHRFGDALSAVLLYGSCLHRGDVTEGIVDLYAVVRDYRSAYAGVLLRLSNAALPPNVFYDEVREGDVTLRAKVAVLSEAHLEVGASRWFHSYVWARFAQPSRLVWARDAQVRHRVEATLARAVLRFHREAVPALPGPEATADEVWARGLALTYASELRPEGAERVAYHVRGSGDAFGALTRAALPALETLLADAGGARYRVLAPPAARRAALRRWRLRRWQGKALSVLRLAKAVFTFSGSADYVAWKIQRHTGVPVEVTPFMRRHPLLVAPWMLVRFLRSGILR